jgi:hypothetical protein
LEKAPPELTGAKIVTRREKERERERDRDRETEKRRKPDLSLHQICHKILKICSSS